MQFYDLIVIGAGINGASAAYQASRRGLRTLLLEQFEFGHTRGSSHGETRIFRFAYRQAEYTRLAMQARPMRRELEGVAGEPLLLDTGGIDVATDAFGLRDLQEVVTSLRAVGAAWEELDVASAVQRFPQWRLPAAAAVVYSPDTGVLHADACVAALLRQAAMFGAVLHERAPALRIDVRADHVEVATTHARYAAQHLIVAAGACMNRLLAQVGVTLPLTVTQEQVVYFRPRTDPADFTPPHFPVWIHHGAQATYGFPVLFQGDSWSRQGVKLAFHQDGLIVEDVERSAGESRPEVTARLRRYLETYLPGAAGAELSDVTCRYTNTPDHDFIIDTLPDHPHVAVGSACSGHGFKFGPATGQALVDLVTEGKTEMSVAHCRIGRWGAVSVLPPTTDMGRDRSG